MCLEVDISLSMLSNVMRARLIKYVEGFKTGDFDTVRAMLADDVKFNLIAKLRKRGCVEGSSIPGEISSPKIVQTIPITLCWAYLLDTQRNDMDVAQINRSLRSRTRFHRRGQAKRVLQIEFRRVIAHVGK
jgi:hypothetical protein